MASISKDDYQVVSFATKKVYDFLKNEPDNTQKRIEAIKHIESVLDVLKKHREKFASDDLKFSSVNKAFQHLADLTGKRVKIANTYKVGDIVTIAKDGLVKHSKSIPAYLGYSQETMDWRSELSEREDKNENAVVTQVFSSGGVDIKFEDGYLVQVYDYMIEPVISNKFATENEALQHLADLTGKRVKIAVEEANLKDNKRFIDAYIEAMLWSSNDDSNEQGGEPLDKNYDENDLSPELIKKIEKDCIKFIKENYPYIEVDMKNAGHDFWLTRNSHGAGFWDGDWEFEVDGKNAGKYLTEESKKFGEINPYVGDDGKIYGA